MITRRISLSLTCIMLIVFAGVFQATAQDPEIFPEDPENPIIIAPGPSAVVPGAVLILDASNNPAHPDAWTNLGTAGGELSGEGNPPALEEGAMERPDLGIVVPNAMFYTAHESGQCFGGPGNTVELLVEDWTVEFVCRRNGEALGEEHQFAGFQTDPPEGQQGIRLWMQGDPQVDLGLSIHAEGSKQESVEPIGVVLEEGVWTWLTLVGTSGESIVTYQDGVPISEQPGFVFDPAVPLATIIIGANSYGERARTFNGSIALVRVYDVALSAGEVLANILAMGPSAVEPDSKLTTTWGTVKTEY